MPSNAHERLLKARLLAGYQTAADAADAIGVAKPTYYHHENGTRGFGEHGERYARFYKVSYEWLMTGRGEPRQRTLDARAAALSEDAQDELQSFLAYLEMREAQKRAG